MEKHFFSPIFFVSFMYYHIFTSFCVNFILLDLNFIDFIDSSFERDFRYIFIFGVYLVHGQSP